MEQPLEDNGFKRESAEIQGSVKYLLEEHGFQLQVFQGQVHQAGTNQLANDSARYSCAM